MCESFKCFFEFVFGFLDLILTVQGKRREVKKVVKECVDMGYEDWGL